MTLKHYYSPITGSYYFVDDEPKSGKEKRNERRKKTNNMKNLLLIFALFATTFGFSQTYEGTAIETRRTQKVLFRFKTCEVERHEKDR